MKKIMGLCFALLAAVLGFQAPLTGQWFLDFENGLALSGFNDVRIPGGSGTLFSFSEELKIDPAYFFRLRAGYQWKKGHHLSVFASPLRLRAEGTVGRELLFFEEIFPADIPLEGIYQFNSYRLTYRYDFLRKGKWRAGIGFTAKIRDAAIKVEGDGRSSNKTNVGFVPLINFRASWQFHPQGSLLLEGDAAWAPQGRAEDVLLALQYRLGERLTLKAGYRILEGGADVEEVYNFSLFHFLSVGLICQF
ncbi:MAG: hypothetical protein FJY83_10415 [Candidatus Aminicenantes bacterium]|nr:hypothetical protein [Candidatus Aminicenantes bacterium]